MAILHGKKWMRYEDYVDENPYQFFLDMW